MANKKFSARYSKKGMDVILDEYQKSDSPISRGHSGPTMKVDISVSSVLTILAVLAGIYVGLKLIQVIAIVFFAFIISSAALPSVRRLQERGVPKALAIGLVYFLGFFIVMSLGLLVIIPSVGQFRGIFADLPGAIEKLQHSFDSISLFGREFNSETIQQYLKEALNWFSQSFVSGDSQGVKSAFSALFGVAGGLFSIVTASILSVYIVYDHDNFVDYILLRILDDKQRKRVRQLVFDVETKLGGWLVGQALLSLIVGSMSWLLLTILGVPFALPLAVLAGLLESIPSLGPTLSAIPAVLIAFVGGGPFTGILTLIGFVLIQNLENTLIVPSVMSNAVGLKPIIVIVAVASGFTLAGPIGALLAVPIAVLFEIGYQFYIDLQKLRAKGIV